MAGVDTGELESECDPNLKIITEVFRPFLMKNLRLTKEFLSQLISTTSLDDNVLRMDSVDQLLEHLATASKKGTYAGFVGALRNFEDNSKYIADFIEGSEKAIRESECREQLQHLLIAFAPRFCEISPKEILGYIMTDIGREERERVNRRTDNEGEISGAMELFTILLTKGPACFKHLITGLRANNHIKLADELGEFICCEDGDTWGKLSSICQDPSNADTGTVVDEPVEYSGCSPLDDNASGLDTSVVEEKPNLACTSGSSLTSVNLNLNSIQEDKKDISAKDVPSQSDGLLNGAEQDGVSDGDTDSDSSDNSSSPEVIPIELRNYQKELVAAALEEGKNSVVVAPTGSGKTVIAARLAKAVLDREPNVGPRTGNANPPSLVRGGSNKVIFIVNKVPLVKQQCDLFKKYIDGKCIMPLSGEGGIVGSLADLLEHKDVLVMTAQILVNALQGGKEDNDRMDLSKIGLLILDECHHCQKGDPYNEIMAEYRAAKLSTPHKARPQVLGLTASMGVGKAKTRYKAQTHILTLCANLDAEKLCTVQNPDNLEELRTKRDKPTEVILPVPGRKTDIFKKDIKSIMDRIEDLITETPGGEIIRKECSELKCPPNPGTQVYEQWLVRMQEYIAAEVVDNEARMRLVICVDNLKVYNNSLYLNRDARTQDALEHLEKHLTGHVEQDQPLNDCEQQILTLFTEKRDHLKEASINPANKNPLLKCLSKTLIEALAGKDQSRGILFCRTRAATEALLAWIEDTEELKFLKPGRLIGCGGTGMTQKQQAELLSLFRDGNHQLILATSVAEEGLDIQQCNVVIRYNYISNDIGRVQAQGRNRAKDGKFYLIVSEELKLHEKEFMNQIREKMMFEVTQKIQKMTEEDFLTQIAKIQRESTLERKLKKFNSRHLKHSKKLMKVHLTCRRCGAVACTADDIRCIQDAHHVVLSEAFENSCTFMEVPTRSVCLDMELRKRIMCGNKAKACVQEWGYQMLYKGCLVNLISPKNYVMKMPKGPARIFKKWKDVPFQIASLSVEELDKICNVSLDDDDEEDDEEEEMEEGREGQVQGEEARVEGDGREQVTMATTAVQPRREIEGVLIEI